MNFPKTTLICLVALCLLLGATAVHFFFVALLGRLPRLAGLALVGTYGYFLWQGLLR